MRHISHFADARFVALTRDLSVVTCLVGQRWTLRTRLRGLQKLLRKATLLERQAATLSRITVTEVSFLRCGRG